ncbi:MAG TPA: class I SAM-dependent methyltransferase [Rhizomicrobium sp.]|nr:class I SAM-dependent methyltransferase [Rhizomicrobium sp.]
MSDMQRQYQDSTRMMARAMLHIKYGPRGKPWSLADLGLIKTGDRVLDIGCGPGRFWAAQAQTLPSGLDLVLADLSPGMVDEAVRNANAAQGAWNSVTGEAADVCALPFAANSFDVVTAMHMLYHAPDKDLAVAQIVRVLKPGGALIVTTNGSETMAELNALSHAIFGTPQYDLGSGSFSLESGAPILRRHFQRVEVTATTDILNVTDAQDIVNYLRSFPPGDEADEASLRALDSELAARMSAQGGVFPITRIAGHMVASGHTA